MSDGGEASKAAWERFVDTHPSADSLEAFFTGYREGMKFGMKEGQALCEQLFARAGGVLSSSGGEHADAE